MRCETGVSDDGCDIGELPDYCLHDCRRSRPRRGRLFIQSDE